MNNRLKYRIWDKKANSYTNSIGYPGASFHCVSNYYLSPDGEIVDFVTTIGGNQDDATKGPVDQDDYIVEFNTGLTDKNGKEVYEGDIVKIKRWYLRPFINNKQEIDYKHIEGDTEVGHVIWGWNSQKFLVSYEHIRYDDSEDFDKSSHSVEVIGNIFENPELLK